MRSRILAAAVLAAAFSLPCFGEDDFDGSDRSPAAPSEAPDSAAQAAGHPGESESAGAAESAEPADGAEHAFHRNHLAAFCGFTLADRDADASAGLDYELRLGSAFGLAAMAEVVFAHDPTQVYGLGLAWHPSEAWAFALLPAWEIGGEGFPALARLAGEREFEVGSLSIAPSVGFDVGAEGLAPVLGIAVGSGF